MATIHIIGSGFSGLSSAAFLAQQGNEVTVFEKNRKAGGRASKLEIDGFNFDMGPSWYWMPEVFEDFFGAFGKKVSDYYELIRLNPSYKVFYKDDKSLNISAEYNQLRSQFEELEPGSGKALDSFLEEAKYKYKVGIGKLVHKPGKSITEFWDWELMRGLFKLDVFASMAKHVRKYFKNPQLIQLMEFPVLFLGARPEETPALYSLMNYADIKLGTWYPMGGMYKIIEGMVKLAESLGVKFRYDADVTSIEIKNGKATGLKLKTGEETSADLIVCSADYHHAETKLLAPAYRDYSDKYWNERVMAPSSLIFFIGLDCKLPGATHHSLFFDADFSKHSVEIYKNPAWPENPLFYLCTPSVTDSTVAPEGNENLFILIPVAAGLEDSDAIREKYFHIAANRIQERMGVDIREHLLVKQSFAHRDFVKVYNAFKGNAYGLANTLLQTANLKPRMQSKKVSNLFYTGQLTVPGPGVPPSLISGKVVSGEIKKYIQKQKINEFAKV